VVGATPSFSGRTPRYRRSHARQHQIGAQAADRGGAERKAAAIEAGQFHHDREAQPRPRLGLVQPAAAPRDLPFAALYGWRRTGQPATWAALIARPVGAPAILVIDVTVVPVDENTEMLPPPVLAKLGLPNAKMEVVPDDVQFWLDMAKSLKLVSATLDAKIMMAK